MPRNTPRPDDVPAVTVESESARDTGARNALITGMPPRIPPVEPSRLGAEAYEIAAILHKPNQEAPDLAGPNKGISESIAILLHNPALTRQHFNFGIQVLRRGALAGRDRELAVLRTTWLCQAPFAWGEHVKIGKEEGLTSVDIERVTQGSAAPDWNDHERAIMRAVEELHTNARISDETWTVLARELDEKQLVELPMLVGQYHTCAFYQNSLRFRLMPDNPGLSAR
jgi:alkylhydroperoxidase family enzyme